MAVGSFFLSWSPTAIRPVTLQMCKSSFRSCAFLSRNFPTPLTSHIRLVSPTSGVQYDLWTFQKLCMSYFCYDSGIQWLILAIIRHIRAHCMGAAIFHLAREYCPKQAECCSVVLMRDTKECVSANQKAATKGGKS